MVTNLVTRVQLQTQLATVSYEEQNMKDYILRYGELFNCLSAMNSERGEDLQMTALLASFGKKNTSPFVYVTALLQAHSERVSWQKATSILLQNLMNKIGAAMSHCSIRTIFIAPSEH